MRRRPTFVRKVTPWLRVTGYGLLFGATTGSLTPHWHQAVCAGVAAALVAAVERRIARRGSPAALEGRREAEAARISLELSFDRANAVLESLLEGVVVVDSGGEIVMANPAARRAMDRPVQDPMGKLHWEMLSGDVARHAREAWQSLREEGRERPLSPLTQQIRHSSIECHGNYFDLTAVPVTSRESGQDFGTVFLLVDTTRGHELQQLKDRFLSNVSHELRTPLTNICAYSEILSTLVPGEAAEWPEFVRVIHEEGVQLSRLVDGMFDFLQLESGEAKFRPEQLGASSVAAAVMRGFAAQVGERGIKLEVLEDGAEFLVEVDRDRFEQVCSNLLENAIKFTPSGGSIRVSFTGIDDTFELRVEDSGPGVPADQRAAVFDKFTQLRDHMTDKPQGAGLGLATCRAIVGRLGGLIWCEDSALGGAAFVVRLPLAGQPQLAGAGAMGGF